jgi:putative phage-type endonuclease
VKTVHLEQGSSQWRHWRWDGLGGSDAAAVLGISPYLTTGELFLEKTEPHAEREETFAMRRGRRLEPIARELYRERTGFDVRPLCCQHDEAAWLRVSLDGWWNRIAIEIKCPDWKQHELALEGIIPKHFRPQCCHIAAVTDCEVVHYWSFNDGKKRFGPRTQTAMVAYKASAEDLGELLEAEEKFWERVVAKRLELAAGRRVA